MTNYEKERKRLNDEIQGLKEQIKIAEHQLVRATNSFKTESDKGRNHRMIVCTGHIEYHLKNRLNIAASEFNNLTDDEVRKIVDDAFSDPGVCSAVRQIFAGRRNAKVAIPADETQQA